MKIPIDWLKQYIKTEKTAGEIAESFTALGLMLDKPVETYEKDGYKTEVLDLEHRMDRSDWLSILGCARDLAAYENKELIHPELNLIQPKEPTPEQVVEIKVDCPDIVKRFNTRVFRNITVKESPGWLKNRLESYGIPSINNIVDITNYVMVELGQPMHAQDIDKMEKPEIHIRKGREGEKITTLLGEEVHVDKECFVLTQNNVPTVLGGIVGGRTTAVDENTKNIVLDAGNYDQVNVRRTSRRLKIQNETVLRYDKYLHPKLTETAIDRAAKLILDLAGGEYYNNNDWYPEEFEITNMSLRKERLDIINGEPFSFDRAKNILTSLEYKILEEHENKINFEVPYFRTDVVVEDDLIADILRINGYDKIPISLINMAPPKDITPKIYKFEDKLRDICVNHGLHEFITEPLVPKNDANQYQISLENALTSDKGALRTEIYTTLEPVKNPYFKQGRNVFSAFEIGKIYHKSKDAEYYEDLKEVRVLQTFYKDNELEPVENSKMVKKILSGILSDLGITFWWGEKEENGDTGVFINNAVKVGEIKHDSFYLYVEELMEESEITPKNRVTTKHIDYKNDDLSLLLNESQNIGGIMKFIMDIDTRVKSIEVKNVSSGGHIEKGKRSVLLNVKHTCENFDNEVRAKILESDQGFILK